MEGLPSRNIKVLSTLVRFSFWANERLLDTCELISMDESARPVRSYPGVGSLRRILVHILNAESGCCSFLHMRDNDHILEEDDFRDAAALGARGGGGKG